VLPSWRVMFVVIPFGQFRYNHPGEEDPRRSRDSSMARIMVQPLGSDTDLSPGFVKALSLLRDGDRKPRAGTKPVSKYAVTMVADRDRSTALERSRAGNVPAVFDF
jgi:hypothetical protein